MPRCWPSFRSRSKKKKAGATTEQDKLPDSGSSASTLSSDAKSKSAEQNEKGKEQEVEKKEEKEEEKKEEKKEEKRDDEKKKDEKEKEAGNKDEEKKDDEESKDKKEDDKKEDEKDEDKNDDSDEEKKVIVGSVSEAKNIYKGPVDNDGNWTWSDKYPDGVEEAAENEETAKYAVVVRNQKSNDSRKKLEAHSIIVQSPQLKAALAEIMVDYPGVSCELSRLEFEAPFKPFVHRWYVLILVCFPYYL